MNPQYKYKKGVLTSRGIGWCTHTHNYIGGCLHDCKWTMPDGKIAECYAKGVAEGVARKSYPHGFEHHYVHPDRLADPLGHQEPAKIFVDSMSDLFGSWVPGNEIAIYLDMMRRGHWHVYQSLTKNAPRLLSFANEFPSNLWVGASTPPDHFLGKELTRNQKEKMLHKTLEVLNKVGEGVPVTWMSVEPLSWDVSEIFAAHNPLAWVVIGAASNGREKFQPDADHLHKLIDVLDSQGVPIWYKQNLSDSIPDKLNDWREYWPGFEMSIYMESLIALRMMDETVQVPEPL